jgi:opacity protein-like surface antigen
MKRLWLAGLAGLLALCMTASAQDAPIKPENVVEVTTRDGKTISGRYRDKGDKVILDTADGEVEIPKADIASMKKGEEVPSPVVPAEPAAAPADETPADETPADETPADETPADETPADEVPADEMPADETPADETPADETPADETPADETPADDPPADDPPADDPPADDPPADDPPADDPPADDPPMDDPPADDPPADEAPADEPPADAPEGEGDPEPVPADEGEGEGEGEEAPFPAPAPDIEEGPAASQPTSQPAEADHHHATKVKSWYPEEEEEFGPIDVDYRGPVELSIFGGYRVYSSDLDVQRGGGFIGGARLTLNLFDDHRVGLDFSYSVTRLNFNVDGTTIIGGQQRQTKVRGEVTINSFLIGATYRMDYLRLEYLTPFVRAGLGVNYFDSTEGNGRAFSPTGLPPVAHRDSIDAEFGLLVQLGTGFDYKLDRNWSFRVGTNVDAMINDWADRDSPQFAANVEMGIVWHFQ